jgi:hypothetical protein
MNYNAILPFANEQVLEEQDSGHESEHENNPDVPPDNQHDNNPDVPPDDEPLRLAINCEKARYDMVLQVLRNLRAPLTQKQMVLDGFREVNPGLGLPKDLRTVLKVRANMKRPEDELYSYNEDFPEMFYIGIAFWLRSHFRHCNNEFKRIVVAFNFDGASPFENSTVSLWPILMKIVNCKDHSRPFPVGNHCSVKTSKPKDLNIYLDRLIDELIDLTTNGFKHNGTSLKYTFSSFNISYDRSSD